MNGLKLLAFLPLCLAAAAVAAPARKNRDDAPFWTGTPSAEAFEKSHRARLAAAEQCVERLLAVKGRRTIENTLRPYDDAQVLIDAVGGPATLIQEVHPDAGLRASADKLSQEAKSLASRLSLNRAVYDALASVGTVGADAETKYYLEKTLRDFRLAGVNKDEETRKKIDALRDEIVLIGQEFNRNIRSDKRKVSVSGAAELEGLPADFIARHKPESDGTIVLTTDYPDSIPVFSYARSEDLRRRMYMEYNNRAFPANAPVLDKLVAKRHELANLLGFPTWADYVTADKMVKSRKNAADFIDKIVNASTTRAQADYEQLLRKKQGEAPGARTVAAWESVYWSERVRKSDFDFDSQSVRPYFPYDRVKKGVLDVTSRLFGVQFKPVKDAPVWHPSVECWEMWDGPALVGRFYFDMHPRKDKYSHAAAFPIRTGVKDRQIPETVLVCNFPGGQEGDPGLMEHSDVVTFFHEFGHLLHSMFAGHHRWVGVGGFSVEQDFVEAPSQMLEEWTWDPATLATFALHHVTNEPIPAALVKQMKRAKDFGKGLGVRRQMVLAKLSLSAFDRAPSQVSFDGLARDLTSRYVPFPFVDGTHFHTAFGHLDGYSAVYYTYMWSLVIAKDLFSAFDRKDLLASATARRYRDAILATGGSAPAADLVTRFLGRPSDFRSYQAWLDEKD